MNVLVLAVSVAILQVALGANDPLSNAVAKQKLIKARAVGYDATVDPGRGTAVKIGISLVCAKLNKRTNKLTARAFERYGWVDKRLSWKPTDYSGITQVSSPTDSVWKPDIRLFNAFPHAEERDDANGIFLPNGTIYWFPPVTYTTLCSPSKDKHTYHCRLVFGAWTYDGASLPLELFEGGFDAKFYLRDCPYVVKNPHATIIHPKYKCCPQRFDNLIVTFDAVERDHDDDHDDDDHDDHHDDHQDDHHEKKNKNCRWPHC